MGLNRLSSTARAMARIESGYIDPYEPGTRRERTYICGISSVYYEDNIDDVATIATAAIDKPIEVYTQNKEWDLDDLEV